MWKNTIRKNVDGVEGVLFVAGFPDLICRTPPHLEQVVDVGGVVVAERDGEDAQPRVSLGARQVRVKARPDGSFQGCVRFTNVKDSNGKVFQCHVFNDVSNVTVRIVAK